MFAPDVDSVDTESVYSQCCCTRSIDSGCRNYHGFQERNMDQLSYLPNQARATDGKREALKWLGRQLQWERRLAELRPGAHAAQKAA
jgi:hypothetical protein